MKHILLAGASGRLGQEILAAGLNKSAQVHAIARNDLPSIAKKISEIAAKSNDRCVVVDVTLPEGTENIVSGLLSDGVPAGCAAVIIGSTGHTNEQLKTIEKLAVKIPVVLSTNFSRGVFLLEELLKAKTSSGASVAELARILGFDLSMWESHHTLKKDAPSGTARTLATAAAIPHERIASTRVGAVVGEHAVFLSQESEELRITHTAHARKLFAEGALDLCERILNGALPAKLYSTGDAYRSLLTSALTNN
ncbi:MAG: hypothetical protein RLZZ488_2253 [Pseudomonadota bacterium]|jgi:4-hydroxy-tetrahydrodipicolinate reductase